MTPDFKKTDKKLYEAPGDRPVIIQVKDLPYVWIDGAGNPNAAAFSRATEALYGFSYALRMNHRASEPLSGAHAYVVGPLEAVWDMQEGAGDYSIDRKADLVWSAMIRQPEFLTKDAFRTIRDEACSKAVKKTQERQAVEDLYSTLQFGFRDGGEFAQILHVGPYDTEPETFMLMESLLGELGYVRLEKSHREIYLNDPRKTPQERLRTILRIRVRRT